MSNGVFYYSNFAKITPLLAVSIHSLRKFYDGAIHVCFGPSTPEFFLNEARNSKDFTHNVVDKLYYEGRVKTAQQGWYEKPFALKHHSPFENTLFYDVDHVFYKGLDPALFQLIEKEGIFSAVAEGLPRRNRKICQEIKAATGVELENSPRISGACIGYNKQSGYVDDWIHWFRVFRKYGRGAIGRNSEEFGLGFVFNHLGKGVRIPPDISYGYPRRGLLTEVPEGVTAIHFCAGRYSRGELWSKAYAEAYKADYMGTRRLLEEYAKANGAVARLKNNLGDKVSGPA